MSVSATFDETFYLSNNADVVIAISQGFFSSGLQHFTLFGGKELRAPNSTFDPNYYAVNNPDVLSAVSAGVFSSVFAHYQAFGETENRAPTSAFATFDAAAYLAANADVAAAVTAGTFSSALDHFISFGQNESRSGSGVTAPTNPGTTFTLTTGVDKVADFTGGTGDDTFVADNTGDDVTSTADAIDGGAGTDTFNFFADGADDALPSFTSIETFNGFDYDVTVTLNTTALASVTEANFHRGDGIVTYNVGANVATVGFHDISLAGDGGGTADTTLALAAADTAVTINMTAVTTAGGNTDEDLDVTGTGLTDVTINVLTDSSADNMDLAGADNITINATGDLTTVLASSTTTGVLTLTGAGDIGLGQIINGIDSVAATGHSGATTMTLAANNADATYAFGSGNDVITTSDDGFATSDGFAVDGGDGTDILILAAAADLDTAAEAARYTNFDTVRTSDNLDLDLTTWATGIQLGGASSKTYSDMTATQAANIQIRGDETSATFDLKAATGSADVLSLTMGTGTTTSAATDIVTGMTVTGFETLNIAENGGATATAGANRTAIIAAFTGATLNDINLTGRAVTLSNLATTVAVDIDGTALTGNGNTGTSTQGLTVSGSAVAGSTIRGSEVNDSFTIGAEGSTYLGNGGTDAFSATATLISADGATDLSLDGGAGTDTLTLTNTTGNTLTDTHFVNLSNMEGLTLTNTGAADTVITTGSAFNSAFSGGATITSGNIAAAQDITVNAGLSTVDTTISVAATSQTGAATETNTFTTGSGADTVTYTDTGFVGVANGAGGTITVDTRAGDDTITITTGTIVSTNTALGTITAGTGKDTITMTKTNANDAQGIFTYVINAGDSTVTNFDVITGFDAGGGATFSDTLDFTGSSAVTDFTNSTDFGVIQSHSLTNGVITFDDAAVFATALTIDSTNLSDVVGYLAANTDTLDTGLFLYDSTGDGTADASLVYNNNTTDSLVQLSGVTGVTALNATNANTANLLDIA